MVKKQKRTERFIVTLTARERRELEKIAREQDKTMSEVVRMALSSLPKVRA